jgi:hypothetical protein
MEPPFILGLSGKARHGKNATAEFIAEFLKTRGVEVIPLGFADAVKEEAQAQGWDGQKDERGRSLLQRIGMERRAQNPNYWVNRAFDRIAAEASVPQSRPRLWVLTDVRFKNEAAAIAERGGKLWRIERREPATHGPWDNGLTAEQKAHASETELDRYPWFDWAISAESLEELRWMTLRGLDFMYISDPAFPFPCLRPEAIK